MYVLLQAENECLPSAAHTLNSAREETAPKGWHSARWKSDLTNNRRKSLKSNSFTSRCSYCKQTKTGRTDPFLSDEYCELATSCHLCGLLHAVTLTQLFRLRQSKRRGLLFLYRSKMCWPASELFQVRHFNGLRYLFFSSKSWGFSGVS